MRDSFRDLVRRPERAAETIAALLAIMLLVLMLIQEAQDFWFWTPPRWNPILVLGALAFPIAAALSAAARLPEPPRSADDGAPWYERYDRDGLWLAGLALYLVVAFLTAEARPTRHWLNVVQFYAFAAGAIGFLLLRTRRYRRALASVGSLPEPEQPDEPEPPARRRRREQRGGRGGRARDAR